MKETGEEESGNGMKNGGQRRKETGEIEGKSIKGNGNRDGGTGRGGMEGNEWKESDVKDKRLTRCYMLFLIG